MIFGCLQVPAILLDPHGGSYVMPLDDTMVPQIWVTPLFLDHLTTMGPANILVPILLLQKIDWNQNVGRGYRCGPQSAKINHPGQHPANTDL